MNQPTNTPCRPPAPASASRRELQWTKARFPAPNHERRSTNPRCFQPTSPTCSPGFHSGLPWAATSLLASPPSSWLPTRFHAPSQEALDPPAVRYSLGPFGPRDARQYLQQSAPRALPRPPRFSMSPTANRLLTKRRLPFGSHRPSLLRLGVAGPFEHVDPRFGDRSPLRIYPNLTNPSTPCRVSVSFPVWKTSRNDDPAVWIPYGRKRQVHRDEPGFPEGPPLEAPRERVLRGAASEVPSTSRADRSADRPVALPIP